MEQLFALMVSIITAKIVLRLICTIALIGVIFYIVCCMKGMDTGEMITLISEYFAGLGKK